LEGTLIPSEEQQKQFEFCNIKTALVNTFEAIQNASSGQGNKPRIEKEATTELKEEPKTELKKKLKAEFTLEFKEELAIQKADIITTANTYVQRLNTNLHEVLYKQMAGFSKEISLALAGGKRGSELLALPPPN
jgi:hypothetical protein